MSRHLWGSQRLSWAQIQSRYRVMLAGTRGQERQEMLTRIALEMRREPYQNKLWQALGVEEEMNLLSVQRKS
jgi:hypothetical protein